MTVFVPTSVMDVQRGSSTDAYGDAIDTATTVATGLPAAVSEEGGVGRGQQRRYRPAENRTTLVETFSIRLRPDADIREGDRLVDQRSGAVFQVQDVFNPRSVVGFADVRVTAVQVGEVSQPVNG